MGSSTWSQKAISTNLSLLYNIYIDVYKYIDQSYALALSSSSVGDESEGEKSGESDTYKYRLKIQSYLATVVASDHLLYEEFRGYTN